MAAGLTQEELGAAAGLDRTMIVKIESGNRRIDAIELVRLSSALQVPVGSLLRSTPFVLSRRTGVVTEEADTEVAREAGRLDLAVVAWLREVQQLVELGVLQPGLPLRAATPVDSQMAARELALWVRKQLGMGVAAIDSMADMSERSGQYVLVTDVRGEGASMVEGDVAVAVVSLEGDPGRRRATAAHELGHLVAGDEYSSDLGVHASRAEREALFDAFAAELLLPSQVLTEVRGAAEAISRDQLIGLAARFRTSWSLALRQAAHAGVLNAQARRDWGRSAPLEASSWRLWGGHLNRISKPFGFRLATRMPSWRHGGGACSQPRGLLSLCTGRLPRQTCQRTLRHTSRRDRTCGRRHPCLDSRRDVLEPLCQGGAAGCSPRLLVDKECWTTQVVLEELRQGAAVHPALSDVLTGDWLRVARLDTLDEVRLFAIWVSRIGSGNAIWGKPAFSRRPSFVPRRPSPTIRERYASPGRTAWTSTDHMAPRRCLPRRQAIGTGCREHSRCAQGDRTQAALHRGRASRLRAPARIVSRRVSVRAILHPPNKCTPPVSGITESRNSHLRRGAADRRRPPGASGHRSSHRPRIHRQIAHRYRQIGHSKDVIYRGTVP